ncbi:MAG: DUF1015 domain-containing protein [Candidatus Cloacimonadota bacterium]|nr:MAG: DUF1015 domain-containing protein [Candidatus Cloacimonadota bacterium]
MSIVKPFKGLRPKPEFAEEVSSPPYDVLSSDEAREMVKVNPHSFLRVVKPEVDVDPSIDLYDERVYNKGKENLKRLIDDGFLIQDKEDCFYVYRLKMGEHVQVGLVAVASIDEYDEGKIKKHENTRLQKEKDRAKHIDVLNAQAGPVFLTYKASEDIDSLIEKVMDDKPVYDFTAEDGIRHTFFIVNDKKVIEAIQSSFKRLDCLYVADGHHRSAAAARVRNERKTEQPDDTGNEDYNYFLTVIFPHNQMYIMDYNRVVSGTNELSQDNFFEKIREKFEIEEWGESGNPFKPERTHSFGMYFQGRWYHLTVKKEIFDENDPVLSLDVSILQENLLNPVLGIEDIRKDKRIAFVGGKRGLGELEKLVNSGKFSVAFSMYPTSIEELMAIADAGKVMPPKSTWFEPKLRSGIITHLL